MSLVIKYGTQTNNIDVTNIALHLFTFQTPDRL